MISRSDDVCAHSAPIAPAWNFCSQIVQTLASTDITANGASAATSRHWIRPLRHQTQRASTTGSMTVDGLLTVASMKKTSDKANRHWRADDTNQRQFLNRRCGALERAPVCFLMSATRVIRVIRGCSCHFRKQKIDKR